MCASLTEGGQRLQYLVYGIGESRSTGGIECKVTYGKSVEHHAVNKPAYDYQLPQQRYTVSKMVLYIQYWRDFIQWRSSSS